MPVYEYACSKCGHVTEALRRMADADLSLPCEKCGSTKTQRAHSLAAVATPSAPGSGASLPLGGSGGCACGKPHGSCGA